MEAVMAGKIPVYIVRLVSNETLTLREQLKAETIIFLILGSS